MLFFIHMGKIIYIPKPYFVINPFTWGEWISLYKMFICFTLALMHACRTHWYERIKISSIKQAGTFWKEILVRGLYRDRVT